MSSKVDEITLDTDISEVLDYLREYERKVKGELATFNRRNQLDMHPIGNTSFSERIQSVDAKHLKLKETQQQLPAALKYLDYLEAGITNIEENIKFCWSTDNTLKHINLNHIVRLLGERVSDFNLAVKHPKGREKNEKTLQAFRAAYYALGIFRYAISDMKP